MLKLVIWIFHNFQIQKRINAAETIWGRKYASLVKKWSQRELTQTYLLQKWSGYSSKNLRSSRNIWTLCKYPGFHQIFSMIQSLIESINIYPSAALLHIEPKAFWSPRWSYRIIRWRLIQAVLDLCEFHTCKFSNLYRNIWLMQFLVNFISLLQFFGYFGSKNCINEIK